MTDIVACSGYIKVSVAQVAVTRLVRLYRYHSAPKGQLGWDTLRKVSHQKNAEGRRTWSIGKLGAGINSAKLVIRARSRPIFRRCSISELRFDPWSQ